VDQQTMPDPSSIPARVGWASSPVDQKGGKAGRGRSSGAPMANDYIPRGDAEFNGWLANFVTYANANLAALGLVAGDMRAI
jgi:hypothetical protein